MSDNTTQPGSSERKRRKVHRTPKTCVECRRRKVRCSLATDSDSGVCTNCRSRNIPCVLQEANTLRANEDVPILDGASGEFWKEATAKPSSQGPPASDPVISERLSQVENVLSQITSREASTVSPPTLSSSNQSKTSAGDAPKQSEKSPASTTILAERSAPVFTLFQKTFFGRPITSAEDGSDGPAAGLSQKLEQYRLQLAGLLPSQEDADMLAICTDVWASSSIFGNLDEGLSSQENLEQNMTKSLNIDVIATSHPVLIGKALLYIVLWIQQLPSRFNPAQLPLRGPPEPYIRRCIESVSVMLSQDELACTRDGLECLILLATLHANAGSIRKAWLIFRRGLNITQLIGLPPPKGLRSLSADLVDVNSESPAYKLWQTLRSWDCRLSLLLGLAPGISGETAFHWEPDSGQSSYPQATFEDSFCTLSGSIGYRNYSGGFNSLAPTQVIDDDISKAKRELPDLWWSIPTLHSESRSQEAGGEYHRLVSQMWFYELEVFLHIPFAFRAVKDRRFEYSKITCMTACEEVLQRYVGLRRPEIAQIYCAVLDFVAFIAATTIILLTLQKLQAEKYDQKRAQKMNLDLVRTAVETMETFAANNPKERMTRRGAEVLRTLLSAYSDPETNSSTMNLDIPFFGKVSIIRPSNANPGPSNVPFVPDTPHSRTDRPVMAGIIPRDSRYTTMSSPTTSIGYSTVSFDPNVFTPSYASANMDWSFGVAENIFFDGFSDIGAGPWVT